MITSEPLELQDAISELPDRQHHLYKTNETIEHLVHYGEWLGEASLTAPSVTLDNRVVELTPPELAFLETTALARSQENQIVIDWTMVPNKSPWARVLNVSRKDDDCYGFWNFRLASVQPRFQSTLVYIEKGGDNNFGQVNFENQVSIYLAITSRRELYELFKILCKRKPPLQGDIRSFLQGTAKWPRHIIRQFNINNA